MRYHARDGDEAAGRSCICGGELRQQLRDPELIAKILASDQPLDAQAGDLKRILTRTKPPKTGA